MNKLILFHCCIFILACISCTDSGNCDEGEDPSSFTLELLTRNPDNRPVFGSWDSPYEIEFITINVTDNLNLGKNIVVRPSSTQIYCSSNLTVGDSLNINIELVDLFEDTLITLVNVVSLSEDSDDGCNVPLFNNLSVFTPTDTIFGTYTEPIIIKI